MNDNVQALQQLQNSIDADVARRTKEHQEAIARIKMAAAHAETLAAGITVRRPLALLANGDSWFDYPLIGNGPLPGHTDVIAQLKTLGAQPPLILNVAHHGDATTDELSLPKQQRMIQALRDPSNWLNNGKPDAILFSGGGNDIAGEQFCIFLDYAAPGVSGLNQQRFSKALGSVEASYLDLFAFRDRYAPGVPIFGHSYDFPIPDGKHPICAGPWLLPSLQFCNWTVADGTLIAKQALLAFHQLVSGLAANPANQFILVPTQGRLRRTDWANELHPTPQGFLTM